MLKLRKYSPEDQQRCVALIQAGHTRNFSGERFRWLHEQSPLGPSEIALCLDDDEIVGIYSVIRKSLRIGDRTYVGGRDVDPVVHPGYRGQGVFGKLLDFGLSEFTGIDFFYNFANPVSTRGFKSRDWQDAGPLQDRFIQLGYRSILSREFLIWTAGRSLLGGPIPDDTREIAPEDARSILAAQPEAAPIWSPADKLAVVRSPRYLTWRYLDSPVRGYRWYLQGTVENPRGLVVGRYDRAEDRFYILDLAGFGVRPRLTDWLPLWASIFPKAWICVWSTVSAEVRQGFLANPLKRNQGLQFLFRPFPGRKAPDSPLDPETWYLTHGDLESA